MCKGCQIWKPSVRVNMVSFGRKFTISGKCALQIWETRLSTDAEDSQECLQYWIYCPPWIFKLIFNCKLWPQVLCACWLKWQFYYTHPPMTSGTEVIGHQDYPLQSMMAPIQMFIQPSWRPRPRDKSARYVINTPCSIKNLTLS